jgi:acetoacetyl-CoA synthetase
VTERPIWEPDERTIERTELTRYRRWLGERGVACAGYDELWRWSVADSAAFWRSLWDYFGVAGRSAPDEAIAGTTMPDVHWFPGVELNFAEHLLAGMADRVAVVSVSETGERRELTYSGLRQRVGAAQAGLRARGVGRGDRVAALVPNTLDTLVAFLASAGLGAIWSSCSPEFGTQAVLDRFAQLEPVILLVVGSYAYGGKTYDKSADIVQLQAGLPTLRATIVLDRDELAGEPQEPSFASVPFEHPLWVLYSSGTTGLPKGIVHGHGGILLESLKQVRLHLDLGPDDCFFWYTTTGWMMWNVVVSGLLAGGAIVLYDGSATHPDLLGLWRLIAETEVTVAGVSAAYVQACVKEGVVPRAELDLSRVRALASTGSPLSPEGFTWLHDAVRPDVPIFSMSGGTDVCTSFLTGSPLLPVYAGELQCRALGVAADAFDPEGRPLVDEVGELVVTQPMPSMPVALWNDPDRRRLRETYFSMYPGVWRHGDWVTITPRGSAVIHGRSDATLNRGGIRMGSSEFYRAVEALPEVADSLVVEDGPNSTAAKLLLFVVLAAGASFDAGLEARIKAAVRAAISPRHVPDEIIEVPELPRTLNGKKLEVPIKRLLQGVPIEQAVSTGSVANAEALAVFAAIGRERAGARA